MIFDLLKAFSGNILIIDLRWRIVVDVLMLVNNLQYCPHKQLISKSFTIYYQLLSNSLLFKKTHTLLKKAASNKTLIGMTEFDKIICLMKGSYKVKHCGLKLNIKRFRLSLKSRFLWSQKKNKKNTNFWNWILKNLYHNFH